MRRCPKCRRGVPDETRVCRACYTVLPEIDRVAAAHQLERAGTYWGVAKLMIFVGVIGAAWLYRFDVDLLSGVHAGQAWSTSRHAIGAVIGRGTPEPAAGQFTAPAQDQARGRGSYRYYAAAAVDREGQGCAISQVITNDGERPLSRMELRFSFEDALGKTIGSKVEGFASGVLPAGGERLFTFRVPCPHTFAHVKVEIPEGSAHGGESEVAFGGSEAWTDLEAGPLRLAVKIPEADVCPSDDICKLIVSFDDGRNVRLPFRRDPQAPDVLIAQDPYLIRYIRSQGMAKLLVPARSGEVRIELTDRALRFPDGRG